MPWCHPSAEWDHAWPSWGGGVALSFKLVLTSAHRPLSTMRHKEKEVEMLDLGAQFLSIMKGHCLPKATKNLWDVIPNHFPDQFRKFMHNCAIIYKFMDIQPRESDILWIHLKWEPKFPFDLHLHAKGFFTMIFKDMQDCKIILINGQYFMNNAGLLMG